MTVVYKKLRQLRAIFLRYTEQVEPLSPSMKPISMSP